MLSRKPALGRLYLRGEHHQRRRAILRPPRPPVSYLTDVPSSSAQKQTLVPLYALAQDLLERKPSTTTLSSHPTAAITLMIAPSASLTNWLKINIDPLIKDPIFPSRVAVIVVR